MLVKSIHKEINGNIDGKPFNVIFVDGEATVNEVVGEFLLRLRSVEKANKEDREVSLNNQASDDGGSSPNEPSTDIKSISDMSLSELKAEASRLNIKIGVGKTKNQIIAMIEGAN